WFVETTTPGDGHFHAVVRTIASARTAFQQVDILETRGYGKLLVLDGRMQSSEGDEFIYHDALVHPGMLSTAEPPRTALVVGGGEGATLREVLAYPSIQRAVMVDIDGELGVFTAMCRTVGAAFPVIAPYQAFISCFGVPWGFLVATKGVDPRQIEPPAVDDAIARRLKKPLRYWDGLTHQHSFALPRFI